VVNVKGTMAGVAAADLSGDGNVDVALTDLLLGNVSVLLGNGDGTFQPRADFAVQNSPNNRRPVISTATQHRFGGRQSSGRHGFRAPQCLHWRRQSGLQRRYGV
jgi:hypothetical protein